MQTGIKFKRVFWVTFLCFLLGIIATYLALGGGGAKEMPPYAWLGGKGVLAFAHRGCIGGHAPENTLAAVKNAENAGYKAVEVDIQQSSGGEFIVFHDKTPDHLLNISGGVQQHSLTELQSRPIYQNDRPTGHHIPSLGELLAQTDPNTVLYLDTKRYGYRNKRSTANRLHQLLQKHNRLQQSLVANADLLFLCYMEWKHPETVTCLEGFYGLDRFFYYCIPRRIRPDLLASSHNKISPAYTQWLIKTRNSERFIAYGIKNRQQAEALDKIGIRRYIEDCRE